MLKRERFITFLHFTFLTLEDWLEVIYKRAASGLGSKWNMVPQGKEVKKEEEDSEICA